MAKPFLIIGRYTHGAVERFGPVGVRGVVMWMGDDDGFEAAFGVDLGIVSSAVLLVWDAKRAN